MRNVGIVIRHEIVTMLGTRSFWLMTFIFPVLIMGFSLLPNLIAQDAIEEAGLLPTGENADQAAAAIGYVDRAGAIRSLPPGVTAEILRPYPDEETARGDLQAGLIQQYYVLPADLWDTGRAVAVGKQLTPLGGLGSENLIEYILNYNLVGDAGLAAAMVDPMVSVEGRALAPAVKTDTSGILGFLVPFVVMFVLFFVITMSGGFMLQSVAKEKENRTAEVLLLSLRPRELMLGKVIGLGVVALLQMGVWLGAGALLLSGGTLVASLAGGFSLPLAFLAWAIVYFILGYLLYASVLGALGALAPTAREGAQFTFVLLLPLMAPFFLYQMFADAPNGPLATGLSIFPLTAPTAMMARMSVVDVPIWQIVLSVGGLAVTTYLFVLLAARFFRADTLLSGESLNWGRLRREVLGRSKA